MAENETTYDIVYKQLQDVACLRHERIRTLMEEVRTLREEKKCQIQINEKIAAESNGIKADYEKIEEALEDEKLEHAKTKAILARESEKLQSALGEVEILTRQLEREKQAFEKALANIKKKAHNEATKKDKLITKCCEIESKITQKEDILNVKDHKIQELQQLVSKQKETMKKQLTEFNLQMQQEVYIAQTLEKKPKKAAGRLK
ncbi:spermatogenesis-associated protein 24 [Protopterus annectens]|uniref:spermatogenesis-associated protein 24 n=1 Tax=Protopterus annectens TaxID=7888 RepID=UPI001CF9A9AC|nr:spermatogenesis-associated protein 24 [Protopterus annectens]